MCAKARLLSCAAFKESMKCRPVVMYWRCINIPEMRRSTDTGATLKSHSEENGRGFSVNPSLPPSSPSFLFDFIFRQDILLKFCRFSKPFNKIPYA